MHRTTKRFLMRVRSITLAASLGVLWAWPLAGYVSPWGNLSPKRPSGTSLEPEPSALVETPEIDTPRIESRSEEHTSELQSRLHIVCRLLLEKKKFSVDDARFHAAARHPNGEASRVMVPAIVVAS